MCGDKSDCVHVCVRACVCVGGGGGGGGFPPPPHPSSIPTQVCRGGDDEDVDEDGGDVDIAGTCC